jgi:hypothetical protein
MEYPIDTQIIEHAGQTVLIEYFRDSDTEPPWERCEGHGNVTRVTSDWYTGQVKKKPEQVVLHKGGYRSYSYLYDFADAMQTAKRDGWNAEPYSPEGDTPGKKALRAVTADIEYLRAWCNDEWSYVGIVCTLLDSEGDKTDISDSCWGFETYKDYHETEGKRMAESANKETQNVIYWNTRDVVTAGGARV